MDPLRGACLLTTDNHRYTNVVVTESQVAVAAADGWLTIQPRQLAS
jgi:hypothetical protein